MIKVTNLNKYYNKKKNNEIHVINDVSLTLPDTGLITFFGASGSGKTTLLNVIGGLDKASGTIEYDDKIIKKYRLTKVDKIRKEKIAYVFQNYHLLLSETVYDNLKIALHAINITDEDEIKKRVEYVLKLVGLYKYRKKLASALSGGQMQRVAIARCLVKEASIIIADEPTGNLDSTNSLDIMNILKKISKTALVLLVTHDKNLAEYFSDSIIEISDGKVINERESDKENIRLNTSDNKIYLQDLEKFEENNDKISSTIYLESKENKKIELKLVERNNVFYLESNVKIKLLEETNLKLIDAKSEDFNKSIEDNSFEYDHSIFSNDLKNSSFRLFLRQIKESFFNFFSRKKRTKFFHFAMFLIGIIVAFMNISLANYTAVDKSKISYDNDVYKVKEDYSKDVSSILSVAKTQGLIDDFYNELFQFSFNYFTNYYQNTNVSFESYVFSTDLVDSANLIKGTMPTNTNEIVLSKKLADEILSNIDSKATYDILIGESIQNGFWGGTKFKVVGIIDRDAKCIYKINANTGSASMYSCFTTSRYEQLKGYLENNGLVIDTVYNITYQTMKEDNRDQKLILVPVIIILFAISLVYIYFSMRSKMINDIYTIGIYRALSYSRTKITVKYAFDIFFMTLFTTALGYLMITLGSSAISKAINKVAMGYANQIVVSEYASTYIILAGIFGVSIIIGILPITSLLRKTPSQILAKYDI
ncbi:MAG: ATP-binding cassette domain-containing protein [Bacilli bacterium]|nr:ATP-binding cassette domain-containing protein [Bacilli bacterium]